MNLDWFLVEGTTSYRLVDEQWYVKVQDANNFRVTLGEHSRAPIDFWVTNSSTRKSKLDPGESLILERQSRYHQCVYWIRRFDQRVHFDSFNLFYLGSIDENRIIRPSDTHLEFISSSSDGVNASVLVRHREDRDWSGTVKLWNLSHTKNFNLEARRENLISYEKCSDKWVCLEKTGVVNGR